MKEGFPENERIWLIQEQLCGFLLDEVISPGGEFHAGLSSIIVTGESAEGTSRGQKGQGSGSGKDEKKKY